MNIKIAIADSDVEYLERLTGVLQQYTELSVSVFYSAEKLLEAMEKEIYEIVLFDPDISSSQVFFHKNTMPVCLGSDNSKNLSMYSGMLVIRKYQRISNLYKELMKNYAKYAKDNGLNFQTGTVGKMIAVYSPIGGSGKTTMSVVLARRLRRLGKRVLFLSIEQLNSSAVCFPEKEEGMISLIEMLGNYTGFELKLKGILKENQDGIYYIESFQRLVDYDDVDQIELKGILEGIRNCNVCDYMIVDTGTTLDALGRYVIESADKVVLIQKAGELEDRKMQLFEQQVLMQALQDHLYVLRNFASSNTHFYNFGNVPVIGTVHHYGNLQLSDLLSYAGQDNDIDISMLLNS